MSDYKVGDRVVFDGFEWTIDKIMRKHGIAWLSHDQGSNEFCESGYVVTQAALNLLIKIEPEKTLRDRLAIHLHDIVCRADTNGISDECKDLPHYQRCVRLADGSLEFFREHFDSLRDEIEECIHSDILTLRVRALLFGEK